MNGVIIVMGVSGCGKSTVGSALSDRLNCSFFDADDFHPKENIEKMSKSIPLTDQDRLPWLKLLNTNMKVWGTTGAVLACSALKESYRQLLAEGIQCEWVYLSISKDQVNKRFERRTGHFMPKSLIESQFNTLEEPQYGIRVDTLRSVELIVDEIITNLPEWR